jgi:hypothetical protein
MITIQTYSPLTTETVTSGPYDSPEILERFLSNKIRQYLRVKTRQSAVKGALFSFGVLPPLKERDGTFSPAGVIIMKDGMPQIVRITRFVGTLASLAEPATFKRYLRKINT